MDRFRFFLEYALLRGLVEILARLPERAGRALARGLAKGVGGLASSRRRLARDNMRAAFPEEPEDRRDQWARELWGQLGEALLEFARLSRMTAADYARSVTVLGWERLAASHAQGKGVLLYTAHCGNWEYTTQFIAQGGLPLAVIARRIKNPFVNDFVHRVRERLNVRVFLHKNAVRESLRWLKQGHVLGLLFDQRITDGGVTVPFFGRPARTTGLPALLALRLGCPVHPVRSWRERGRVFIEVQPALAIEPAEPTEDNITALTARMTAVVETWIRERPAQWLWIHNRWKP